MPPDEAIAVGHAEVEHPAHHVEHVHAHVADDAVAVLHVGAPAPRVDQLVVGPHRRRPGPQLVIEVGRRGRVGRVLRRPHRVVAIDLDQPDLAELAFADDAIARGDQVRRAAALHADLDDALVLARRRQHRLALADVDADRLLDVDVAAGLGRRDHRQRVPVIGRGDQRDVDVLLIEQLLIVLEGARALLRGLALDAHVGALVEQVRVGVAERDDLDVGRHLQQPEQVGLAVPAGADQRDALLHVRELLRVGGHRGERERRPVVFRKSRRSMAPFRCSGVATLAPGPDSGVAKLSADAAN